MVHEKTHLRGSGKDLRGLSDAEVISSREKYGENKLSAAKRRSFLRQFLSNLNDPVIRILLFALLLNILFLIRGGDIYETVGIGISVFLATFISTMSEYSSEAAFRRLGEENKMQRCRVRRGGSVREIDPRELVVGDIILLGAGEKIPADCILLSGSLGVDQSAMTGENKEVRKEPMSPEQSKNNIPLDPSQSHALLGGCVITSGEGEARVAVVGDATFLGGISREVQMDTRESPLRIRLAKLASVISRLGYIAAVLVTVAYLINSFIIDSGMHPTIIFMKLGDVGYLFRKLLHAFTLGLTVVVVAVPEGLPLMISVVLSANIKKMVRDKVLVRKPVGIEAAGSMNILFTDKTGTLTEGHLSVKEYLLGDGSVINSIGGRKKDSIWRYFALSALYNTSSEVSIAKDGKAHALGGNMTDIALTESAAQYSSEFSGIRIAEKIPFDSAKKFSAVRLEGSEKTVLIKGAPEKLLPFVRSYLRPDGSTAPFNSVRFERMISERTSVGGRVILLAVSDRMPPYSMNLTLIGAVHLSDRVRKEAASSVERLRSAGIHVVMVTGDNIETAASIARESGILGGDVDICITSSDLAKIGDVKLRELLPRIGVVARALPSDKSRLVRVAQEADLVVGMTGDGINDAPALRRADIGFAMGSGTQVAKDAGDIIILDNNLASIAKAVLYGRGIFKNIRKFITLQLTMNLCAVGVSMIGPFIGFDAPVTVVQMLWINIIMDTLGGIAFAGEHAGEEYMKERPKKRDESILNRYMIGEILTMGLFTVALCIAFLKMPAITSLFRYDKENLYLLTAFFALFIFASVFNCFSARTDSLSLFHGLGKNKVFIFIMLLIAVIQIAFVYLGGSVLRTVPLSYEELTATLILALLVFPVDFIRKLLLRIFGSKNISY